MREALGDSQDNNYYTEEQYRQIAAVATREGSISFSPVNMADLLENYRRMALQDAFDSTMTYAVSQDTHASTIRESDSAGMHAKALLMANRAVALVENGGDLSAKEYIGSGSPVHDKAVEYLQLVYRQRGFSRPDQDS